VAVVLEEVGDGRAEQRPDDAVRNADEAEQESDQPDLEEVVAVRRGVEGNGADQDRPCLGIDPLEDGGAEETERPAALLGALRPAGIGHAPGEVEHVGEGRPLQNLVEDREGAEGGIEAEADGQDHHREAERDAEDVRHRPPEAPVGSRGQDHHVVRAGRAGRHDDEGEEREERVHRASGLPAAYRL